MVCDKPLTFNLEQAEQLATIVDESGAVFAVTHNYTGYPLVRQARQMILSGELGEINAVRASYLQGWLRTRLENENQKQASWRTDPAKSGAAGCFGDIGTHAYNLARYMTGLKSETVSCHLKMFEGGRKLDDYGQALDPLRERRAGQRHGLANQPRPRERSVHRNRRHQGLARRGGRKSPIR